MNHPDDILKTLDPADRVIDTHGPRARADLQRILATDTAARPGTPGVVAADTFRSRRRRRTGTRIALASGLVAATAAAAIVLPAMVGRDQAFATWTATPSGMPAPEAAKAAKSCRDDMKSGSPEYGKALDNAKAPIAEQRGSWVLVILAGQDGFSALCLGEKRPSFQSMVGSIGTTTARDLPKPRELTTTNVGVTSANDSRPLSLASGFAGSDVKAISYASASRGKVAATVTDGNFALWLPGDEFEEHLSTHGGQGVPLQVTYRDGSQAVLRAAL